MKKGGLERLPTFVPIQTIKTCQEPVPWQNEVPPHTQKVRQKLRFDAMVVESGIQGEKSLF